MAAPGWDRGTGLLQSCGRGLAGLLNDMIGLSRQEELTKEATDLCLSCQTEEKGDSLPL